jgi:cation diffusion facilitator family transporter
LKKAEKVAVISAVSYAILVCYLVVTALLTHSNGVLAGALLAGIRLVIAVLLVFGLRLSERHTSNFPLGLYKLQNLIATCIGLVILVLAYEVAKNSLYKLMGAGTTAHGGMAAFASLLVSAVVAGFFAWYKARVGKQENSPALRADARNSLADFVALLTIIAGILLAIAGIPHVFTVLTVILGLYLFLIGGKLILDGIKVLLDASVDRRVLERVRATAQDHPLVKSVVDVRGRNSGSYQFINLSILVITTDLRQAKRVAEDLECEIRREVPNVDQVRVEFDIEPTNMLLCAVPVQADLDKVAGEFSEAPCFEFIEVDFERGSVVSRECIDNPVGPGTPGRGVRLAVILARRGVEVMLTQGSLADDDVAGTLDAYEVNILTRGDIRTLEEAEGELLAYASERAGNSAGGESGGGGGAQ